ncbi:MAG: hypothetical protein ABI553_00675 [Chloroflexota bacterium]
MAGALGYCGLDRQRRPLRGDEIRGCWEGTAALPEIVLGPVARFVPTSIELDGDRTRVRRLEFVEVQTASSRPPRRRAIRPSEAATAVTAGGPSEGAAGFDEETTELPIARTPSQGRWSLWGEEA